MKQKAIENGSRNHYGFHFLRLAALVGLGSLAVAPVLCAGPLHTLPTLSYSKVMKGSSPEYTAITVDANGVGSYQGRRLDDPPNPHPLKLSPAVTTQLFDLAGELDDFRAIELESRKRVANLGLKTFAYQRDGVTNKVEFNYTENRTAQALQCLFEGIAGSERHLGALEYSARFDPLGLPGELTSVQIDLNSNALVDPQLLVPILEKIAASSQYLHIAQLRAQDLLRRIQGRARAGKR